MWRSVLWRISWLRHQMFYSYVTISAAQAHESDDLWHVMSPFSLLLSSFSGAHPPETGRRRSFWRSLQIVTDFAQRCDVIGLQMLLWRMQIITEAGQKSSRCWRKLPSHFKCLQSCWNLPCLYWNILFSGDCVFSLFRYFALKTLTP